MEKEIDRKVEKTLQEEIEKLKEIESNLTRYREGFVDHGRGWTPLEAFIKYIQYFRQTDIYKFLSELNENTKKEKLDCEILKQIYRIDKGLDRMYYKKRQAREHLLKNFHETFGTTEKPINDRENTLKNRNSFPYGFNYLFFNLKSMTSFDEHKVYERKLTKSEFDKIMEIACTFESLRDLIKNYEGDKKAALLFEAYEEWKNTPYQDSNNNSFK